MKMSESALPVTYPALISTLNKDKSPVLSQVVSTLINGLRVTFDLLRDSKTAENLARTGECVVNLPSAESTAAIERLTRAINSIDNTHDLCVSKVDVAGRMTAAHMTLIPSEAVSALRALECPMQLEARIEGKTNFMTQERVIFLNRPVTVELDVLRVHLDTSIVFRDVHPNMWKPLMNCLREAYRTSSAIPWTR